VANRRGSALVPIQDPELDRSRLGQMVSDAPTMKSAAKENDLLHLS
jgi:hypothetical protein